MGSAFAKEGPLGITKIVDADLVCSSHGNAFFIKLSEDYKAWQADSAEDTEGLEHEVIGFQHLRCPDCYDLETRMDMGDSSLEYKMEIRGRNVKKKGSKDEIVRKITLKAVLTTDEDDKPAADEGDKPVKERKITANCKRINK